MAIQATIEKEPSKTLKELEEWLESENWLAMRAVAAGVAEPRLLKSKETASYALELHRRIFQKILSQKERNADFKILRQGLGYSLSVIVFAVPENGFKLIRKLLESGDGDVLWIVKENLKKDRLVKNFPTQVKSLGQLLKTEK